MLSPKSELDPQLDFKSPESAMIFYPHKQIRNPVRPLRDSSKKIQLWLCCNPLCNKWSEHFVLFRKKKNGISVAAEEEEEDSKAALAAGSAAVEEEDSKAELEEDKAEAFEDSEAGEEDDDDDDTDDDEKPTKKRGGWGKPGPFPCNQCSAVFKKKHLLGENSFFLIKKKFMAPKFF